MPTAKERLERDQRQRKRVRKEIEKQIGASLGKAFDDSMTRLKGITDAEWKAAQEEEALAVQAGKGKGKGWWGPEHGGTHGTTLGKIPGHVWERAQQRTGFKAVKQAVKTLRTNPVLPTERSQQWHMPLKREGRTVGYLVGSDSFAQTVLGASMVPKAGSMEVSA